MIAIRQDLMSPEEIRIVREWLNSQGARLFQEHVSSAAALASADLVRKQLDWPEDAETDDNIEALKCLNSAKFANATNKWINQCREENYQFYRAILEPMPVSAVAAAQS